MAQAARDQNRIPTLLGVSEDDAITPVAIWADPVTHQLSTEIVMDANDISDNTNARRDQNRITTLLGVSSEDGITPVVIYADPVTHTLFTENV